MPGVVFGPEPRAPNLVNVNRGTPDQRLRPEKRSKTAKRESNRARRARQAREKVLRDERLARRMQSKLLLEWLRERPCEDLPAGPQRAEKTKRQSHHGTEEVTSQVGNYLKLRKTEIL